MTTPGDTQPDNGRCTEAAQEPDSPSSLIKTWSASGIKITDIAVEPCGFVRGLRGRYIVAACGLAILMAGVFVSFSTSSPAFCCLAPLLGVGGAVGLCLCVFAHGSAGREARRAIRAAPPDEIYAALAEHTPKLPAEYVHGELRRITRRLGYSTYLRGVLRIGSADALRRVEPITVPFEPRSFESIDEELETISGGHAVAIETRAKNGRASALGELYRPAWEWLSRRYGWIGIAAVVVGIMNLGRFRDIESLVRMLGIVFVLGVVVHLWRTCFRERQALVVPGALLVRESGWRSKHWSTTMFEPHEAVLVVCRLPGGNWELLVANQDRWYGFEVSQAQAEFILRAWLSPLAPPTLEQLSDLR